MYYISLCKRFHHCVEVRCLPRFVRGFAYLRSSRKLDSEKSWARNGYPGDVTDLIEIRSKNNFVEIG